MPRAEFRSYKPTSRYLSACPDLDYFRLADHSALCKQDFYLGGPCRPRDSKGELKSKLDNSRIAAGRDDAAEIAANEHLSRRRIDAAIRCDESIQVADGIGKIWMIEQVEELRAKFERV